MRSLLLILGLVVSCFAGSFSFEGEQFLLNDEPFVVMSGEMHYPRVPKEYWRDRCKKARAMGLNTICTYVFWNAHEKVPGEFDFSGQLDVARFVQIAQEEGLWVIVRPGPYVCAEWEFGGLPAWLLKDREMTVRSIDPLFLAAVKRYFMRLADELAPLHISRGGPILMTQIENEYGSFDNDHEYMQQIEQIMLESGFDGMFFTADGPTEKMLDGGTLPHVVSAVNFYNDPEMSFSQFAEFRQNVPRMCGEYWTGWFDHWGFGHHTRDAETVASEIDWMLAKGISVNLYVFHGGTTFGFMNGANVVDGQYRPDVSSYDYDAPLDEAGRPTEKFFALREVFKKYNRDVPSLPKQLSMIQLPELVFNDSASLFGLLDDVVEGTDPLTMEELGQNTGLVLYRYPFGGLGKGVLDLQEVRDFAHIYYDGKLLGSLNRTRDEHQLELDLEHEAPLSILVENMGRVNFGKELVDERKGIITDVLWNDQTLTNWEMYRLPLDSLDKLIFTRKIKHAPYFRRAQFELDQIGDAYLDTKNFTQGHAWVNGHHLGRFWNVGPQEKLFVPGPWLKSGLNEVIILELE